MIICRVAVLVKGEVPPAAERALLNLPVRLVYRVRAPDLDPANLPVHANTDQDAGFRVNKDA